MGVEPHSSSGAKEVKMMRTTFGEEVNDYQWGTKPAWGGSPFTTTGTAITAWLKNSQPICDEYIAVIDVKPYASDMECFVPLMEKFNRIYGHYPKYPVADAGYGSYNNYLYCEEHGMEKYMKFTMYKKETTDKKYHENPYRAVNFAKDADGNLLCPNGRKFLFKRTQHVKYNKYGRTEELYECESCEGCPHKQECCPRAHKNRTIRMNQELTAIHQEVLQNLESIHGALLRMNRSIQSL